MSKKKQRVCKNCNKNISKEAFLCTTCKFMLQQQDAAKKIIGKKFNRLTCIRYINSDKHQQFYEFQCDCGVTKLLDKAEVVRGTTKSCGCLRSELRKKNRDLSGLEQHNYKIIKKTNKVKNYRSIYQCLCKCGNYFELSEHKILGKRATKSCGCFVKVKKYKDLIPVWYVNRCKTGAEKRNLEYTISLEDMYQSFIKQDGRCALTGVKLEFSSSTGPKKGVSNASLDRIDNNLGYIPSNIQWVDKAINMLKNKYSVEELINLAKRITEWQTQITPT